MKSLKCIAALLAVIPAAAMAQPGLPPEHSGENWVIGTDGIGPIRLGMTRAQVERLLNLTLEDNDMGHGCVEASHGLRYSGLSFDFANGVLVSLFAVEPANNRTAAGVRVNARMSAVVRAYGPVVRLPAGRHGWQGRRQLQSEVGPAPGVRYLLRWSGPNRVMAFLGEDPASVGNITVADARFVRPGACGSAMTPSQ